MEQEPIIKPGIMQRVEAERKARSEQQIKQLNESVNAEQEAINEMLQKSFQALIEDNDRREASRMEAEIQEAKAKAEAEIRAKYAGQNRRGWNESKTDQAFRELAKSIAKDQLGD